MNIQNEGILNSKPGDPTGFVSKDGEWAAVGWSGKKYMIIHKGQQVHTTNNYSDARSYIAKQIKATKNSTSSLEQFLSD
ncbi:MAG: hypothetical protein EBU90_17910 [Proteobacteria bacterium]|jgi:hypothetical protein|nr:hypothetical protein [Pseudomonadota bacterium]NBP56167.1 hypothetical protein [Candidatus Elulimicrobium humile]